MIPDKPVYITGNEAACINEAINSGALHGDGPFTRKCESLLQHDLKCPRALLTHSGTAALEMAAQLCDIKPGDEVIMPSFTFTSTATAVTQRGGIPVFVDIDPHTCNIDPERIKIAIGSGTRGIIVVHYAGFPCDMNKIMQIARENNLWIIEDAAQAIYSQYAGQYLGTIGDYGCLSFHESKNIQCGEGGALLINRPEAISRAEIIREKGTNRAAFFRGQVDKYTWVETGSSWLPSELNAAFLYAQLGKGAWITRQKVQRLFHYHARLKPLANAGKIALPPLPEPYPGNGHICFLLAGSLTERTALTEYLRRRDIRAFFHYVPLHSSTAGLKYGRTAGKLDITERVSECLLRLPIYPHMSSEEVDIVADAITEFYS